MLTPDKFRAIYAGAFAGVEVPPALDSRIKAAMVSSAQAQHRVDVEIALAQRARRTPTFACCGNCAQFVADQIKIGAK